MRNLVHKMLKTAGRDLIRYQPRLSDFLEHRRIDHVIDVGANEGQFARLLRRIGYGGQIHSLEPVAAVFEALRRNAAGDAGWSVYNYGCGDADGAVQIGVSQNTAFSSIRPMTAAAVAFDPAARVVSRETIQVRRLDGLMADLRGEIFLKIDTQGYEAQVLAGAGGWLDTVAGVQMELPCLHLYDGVWSMAQALETMQGLGFSLFQVQPVNVAKTDPIAPIELDCVFGRIQ